MTSLLIKRCFTLGTYPMVISTTRSSCTRVGRHERRLVVSFSDLGLPQVDADVVQFAIWQVAVEMSLQSLFHGHCLVKHVHNQLLIHVCFLPNVDLILTKLLQICCDVPVDEQNLRLTLLHFLQHAVLLRLDGAHGCLCLVDLTRIAVPHRLYLTIEIVLHLLPCDPDLGAKFTAGLLDRLLDEYFHFSCKFRVNVSIKLRKGRLWLCAASLQGWICRRLLHQLGRSPVSQVFVHFDRTLG